MLPTDVCQGFLQHMTFNVVYAKVVEDSKWKPIPAQLKPQIRGKWLKPLLLSKILGRCIFGSFDMTKSDIPTLLDVRRSSSTVWKKAFEVNIYEMMGACFLFEFPDRNMAEQILQGEWIRKKSRVKLEWWNPPAVCVPASCKPKTK